MKKRFVIVLTLLIITKMISAETKTVETKTLFDRLGGTDGITAIVDDVIDAHMNNPAISSRFSSTNWRNHGQQANHHGA